MPRDWMIVVIVFGVPSAMVSAAWLVDWLLGFARKVIDSAFGNDQDLLY